MQKEQGGWVCESPVPRSPGSGSFPLLLVFSKKDATDAAYTWGAPAPNRLCEQTVGSWAAAVPAQLTPLFPLASEHIPPFELPPLSQHHPYFLPLHAFSILSLPLGWRHVSGWACSPASFLPPPGVLTSTHDSIFVWMAWLSPTSDPVTIGRCFSPSPTITSTMSEPLVPLALNPSLPSHQCLLLPNPQVCRPFLLGVCSMVSSRLETPSTSPGTQASLHLPSRFQGSSI